MAVEIYIARHGQNEDNLNGILNGHRDLPLTELGRTQAQQLADGVKTAGLQFNAIYCSPLQRAKVTAEIVADTLELAKPIVLQDLIERDFGIMTGQPANKIEELCSPDILKTDTITYFLNPEGAETFPQLIERGHDILEEVRALHKSGNVMLVCHGDIGKMIYAAATGKSWQDVLSHFHFGNCELIEVSGNDDVHIINIDQHNA